MNVLNSLQGQRPKATDVNPGTGFTGKGFRSTAIEYFVPSENDRACAWLAEG